MVKDVYNKKKSLVQYVWGLIIYGVQYNSCTIGVGQSDISTIVI